MPTKKKRFHITVSKDAAVFIKKIALRDEVPESTKISQLLEKALELEEDEYFSKLAEERDTPDAKFISHEEAWKHFRK